MENKKGIIAETTTPKTFNTNNNSQNQPKQLELFPEVEPWPEPVDGVALANEIKGMLETYLYLPNGASTAITIWIMHTYGTECFDFTPRLYISSPMPGCGKSTLITLVEKLSYHALLLSNITAASMFRIISEYKPTLLIDEADTFLKNNEELRGIINAGYQRGGTVSRVETINKRQTVCLFPCYGACAIAGIGGTHKTIQDRSVNVIMVRKTSADKIERMRTRNIAKQAEEIRSKCMRFMFDNAYELSIARPPMPDFLGDRGADIWEPLFAIAQVISADLLTEITTACKHLQHSQENDDESSIRFQLLGDIRSIFESHPWATCISSTDLVGELIKIEESPWAEYGFGRGLNPHSLAKQLKFFGIYPRQIRGEGTRNRSYFKDNFQDAFDRYLPQSSEQAAAPAHAEVRHNGTIKTNEEVIDEAMKLFESY